MCIIFASLCVGAFISLYFSNKGFREKTNDTAGHAVSLFKREKPVDVIPPAVPPTDKPTGQ